MMVPDVAGVPSRGRRLENIPVEVHFIEVFKSLLDGF